MNQSSPQSGRHFLLAILAAAIVFAFVAPTLRWPQLTGGNENIIVQTALEIRRGGPWLVPTMLGEPRIKKPPLVAWITALSMRQSTLDQLKNPATREQAYVDLAWQVRWTGLLAGCVTMLATYFLGKAIYDSRLGLVACMVAGTTILFQKYMRQSTSDVHLAMWVTIANAGFACALFREHLWRGMLVGGIATGLAFLCKGPVALLDTVLPAMALVLYWRWQKNAVPLSRDPQELISKAVWIYPLISSAALFAMIALPWFVHVYFTVPDVAGTWTTEVSRQGASGLAPDSIYAYIARIPMNWPWIVMLIVGIVTILRARGARDVYAVGLLVLPLIVLTLIPDRKERYLLPFVAPLALIAARGVMVWIGVPPTDRSARWIGITHWVVLAVVCIGFPIAGAMHPDMLRVDGSPWYPLSMAIWCGVGFCALIGLGALSQRYFKASIVMTTFICVLALQAIAMWAYKDSPGGRSSLKLLAEIIRQTAPDVDVFDYDENVRVDEELAIYLNRTILRIDPATMTSASQTVVYVTCQDRGEADPPAPAGYQFLARVQDRKNYWWAFVRSAASDSVLPMSVPAGSVP